MLYDDLRAVCRSVVNNQITIAKSGNGPGKTWVCAAIAVWFFLTQDRPQVYCAAAPPEGNLRNLLWAEILANHQRRQALFDGHAIKDLMIKASPLSFLTGVTIPQSGTDAVRQARFSGKHAPSILFIFDEGDAIPDPVYDGAETCMSGGFARMLIPFNPRARMGAVYRMIRDRQGHVITLNALNHPNVVTGQDIIPGAVDRAKTVRRIAQWCRPLALDEKVDNRCFELPRYLEGAVPVDQQGQKLPPLAPGWYRIVVPQFSHVVLGEYPAQSDTQLISEEWIYAARSRWDQYVAVSGEQPPALVPCRAGLDVAEYGVDCAALCRRWGTYVARLSVWEGKVDPLECGDLAAVALAGVDVSAIYCDGTGVGAGTAPYLQRQNWPAVNVKVADASKEATELGEFRILRDELLWAVREWLRLDLAMLPPDEPLLEELLILTYEVKNGKIRVMSTDDIKEQLKRSPDRLMSLALTFVKTGFFDTVDLS